MRHTVAEFCTETKLVTKPLANLQPSALVRAKFLLLVIGSASLKACLQITLRFTF